MSLTTKRALAESFKKLLGKKSFDKITVKDIVEDCGVNRQTFYYHFHDVYDLIEWIFQDATEGSATQEKDYSDWDTGLEALITYLQNNRILILNAYNSISHEVVANYIKKAIYPYAESIVRKQAAAMEKQPREEDLAFVTDIFVIGATGFINGWIGEQMQSAQEPNARTKVKKFSTALSGCLQLMLHNLSESERA